MQDFELLGLLHRLPQLELVFKLWKMSVPFHRTFNEGEVKVRAPRQRQRVHLGTPADEYVTARDVWRSWVEIVESTEDAHARDVRHGAAQYNCCSPGEGF